MKPSGLPITVLVVDDDRDTAESLALMLTMHGIGARFVTRGVDALVEIALDMPDVVVLDVRMPEIDGWTLTERIAEWGKPPTIIAITACSGVDDFQKSADSGIRHHLVKPVDPAVLLGLLERIANPCQNGQSNGKLSTSHPKTSTS